MVGFCFIFVFTNTLNTKMFHILIPQKRAHCGSPVWEHFESKRGRLFAYSLLNKTWLSAVQEDSWGNGGCPCLLPCAGSQQLVAITPEQEEGCDKGVTRVPVLAEVPCPTLSFQLSIPLLFLSSLSSSLSASASSSLRDQNPSKTLGQAAQQ